MKFDTYVLISELILSQAGFDPALKCVSSHTGEL